MRVFYDPMPRYAIELNRICKTSIMVVDGMTTYTSLMRYVLYVRKIVFENSATQGEGTPF